MGEYWQQLGERMLATREQEVIAFGACPVTKFSNKKTECLHQNKLNLMSIDRSDRMQQSN